MRSLAHVARRFSAAATSVEVLEALAAVVRREPFTVVALWPQHLEKDPHAVSTVIYHPAVSAAFRDRASLHHKRDGPSLIARYCGLDPKPITLTEAMRRLQPTGGDRWVFDLYHDHGFKDALYCSYGSWILVYGSGNLLRGSALTIETRMALDAAGSMAVTRLKELEAVSQGPELSAREKTTLLHLSEGLTPVEIAVVLGVGESTVRTFIGRAVAKLGARSHVHAVAIAIRRRLI